MNALLRLICRIRGHRWGKAYPVLAGFTQEVAYREKRCSRCDETRPVKRRAKKGNA